MECLESEIDSKSYTILLEFVTYIDIWMVVVVETAYVLYRENLEDVANAYSEFHVWLAAHSKGGLILISITVGEVEQFVVVRTLHGVVALSEVSVEHLEAYEFTQLHLFEKRDSVEHLSVEIPVEE